MTNVPLAKKSDLTAFTSRRRTLGGIPLGEPAAGRAQWLGTGGLTSGKDFGNYRALHVVRKGAGFLSGIRLKYVNAYGHETTLPPNNIDVRASIEYPAGTFYRVFFNGRRTVTIEPGGEVYCDPVGLWIPEGKSDDSVYFWSKTNVLAPGGQWPLGEARQGGAVGGAVENSNEGTGANVDETLTAAGANSGSGFMFRPIVVLGNPQNLPSVIVVSSGDSIACGTGDNSNPPPNAGRGFIRRAINDTLPYLSIAAGGNRAQWMATDANRLIRGSLVSGGTHAPVLLGINDFINSRTAAQCQQDLVNHWIYLAAKGLKVWACTIPPRTTSTDGWATLVNQTLAPVGTDRPDTNNWIRAGAPIVNNAPVAVGTVGALLAGQAGHPLVGYFETADAVESTRDSGKYKAAGRTVTDAAITSGAAALTSATAAFTSADVGAQVNVVGAGAAGALLNTFISAYVSATQVTLAANAGTTVSGATAAIDAWTVDGTHPSTKGHVAMAAVVTPASFT